jgi:hypothetical protein
MMITEQEKQEIIDRAVEETLRRLPEVVGNLMVSNTVYSKMSEEFYSKHKEFTNHREIVQTVVAQIESSDPTKNYETILAEAVPQIRQQIQMKGKVNMDPVQRSGLKLSFDDSDNGAI